MSAGTCVFYFIFIFKTWCLQFLSERWCLLVFSRRQFSGSSSSSSDPKSNLPSSSSFKQPIPVIMLTAAAADVSPLAGFRLWKPPRLLAAADNGAFYRISDAFFRLMLLQRLGPLSRPLLTLTSDIPQCGGKGGGGGGAECWKWAADGDVCCCFYSTFVFLLFFFGIKLSTWRWELLHLCWCHVKSPPSLLLLAFLYRPKK